MMLQERMLYRNFKKKKMYLITNIKLTPLESNNDCYDNWIWVA